MAINSLLTIRFGQILKKKNTPNLSLNIRVENISKGTHTEVFFSGCLLCHEGEKSWCHQSAPRYSSFPSTSLASPLLLQAGVGESRLRHLHLSHFSHAKSLQAAMVRWMDGQDQLSAPSSLPCLPLSSRPQRCTGPAPCCLTALLS